MHPTKIKKPGKPVATLGKKWYFKVSPNLLSPCEHCGNPVLELTGKTGKLYAVEVYAIRDVGMVYAKSDFHSYYCSHDFGKPVSESERVTRKRIRADRVRELLAAAKGENKPKEEEQHPERERPANVKTYYCPVCGSDIWEAKDDERPLRNAADNLPHTCMETVDELRKQRSKGTRMANKIPFAEISRNVSSALDDLADGKGGDTLRACVKRLEWRLYHGMP